MSASEPRFEIKLLHPRYWITWFNLGLGWLAAQLPFSWQIRIGRLLGKAMQKALPRRIHIARTNLALCFPEKPEAEREHILNASFESAGIAIMESIMSWWAPDSTLKNRASIEGLEHIEKALKQNRGVILLGAHFTTLEIAGNFLSDYVKFDALYRKHKNPVFDYVMYRGRSRKCDKVIERGNMREMMRRLKQGKVIWYAPDQNYGAEHSVFVDFFNVPAATITATSKLASLNNSPVIPTMHQRINDSEYILQIAAPLENFPSDDVVKDARRINHVIEQAIIRMPEQYLWSHRRFKTRPDNLPPVY